MKLISTILLGVWTVLMAFLFFTPGSSFEGNLFFEGEDKVAHFSLFFGWAFLLSMRGHYTKLNTLQLQLVIIFLAVFGGILIEILQGYIPYRSRDIFDFIADMVGTIAGIIGGFVIKKTDFFWKLFDN